MAAELPGALANDLRRLSLNLPSALAAIAVPAYVIDAGGVVRWQNAAALETIGDYRGESYLASIAPESRQLAREQFVRKVIGNVVATSYDAVMFDTDGRRHRVDIDSVQIEEAGMVVGVFGLLELDHPVDEEAARDVRLTPRQLEVLKLLAGGCSTQGIASRLHISTETVRNHVRHVLRALDVHSRLEAVIRARELGILDAKQTPGA